MKTLFTITPEESERYKANGKKGLYLKKADKELPEMPQSTDALQTIEDLKTENQSLNEQISVLTECLLEMSEAVYA